MNKSNIRIYQKKQNGFSQIGIYKYPSNEDWRYIFENYVIIKYFGIDIPDGFNPENIKKGLCIQRVQLMEGIEVNELLHNFYSLIKDSKLKTQRTKKTIGDLLFESLEDCLNINNKKHETPSNMVVEKFPDDNYTLVLEPKKENYLSIRYKDPSIDEKIEIIKGLMKNLDVKNSKIDNLLYKLTKSKPDLTDI